MKQILIIEDDEQLSRLLELELIHQGYEAKKAADGKIGLAMFGEESFDLVLLDLMLPEMDGLEVCKRIRGFSKVPVIMLTAKDSLQNKISGFDCGADDYVTKPFAMEELFARIKAAMRRNEGKEELRVLSAADLSMNFDRRQVIRASKEIELSKREFDLLEYMLRNKNIVLSRENLLVNVWGYDFMGDSNTVDVYIRYLRSKIDDDFEQKLI